MAALTMLRLHSMVRACSVIILTIAVLTTALSDGHDLTFSEHDRRAANLPGVKITYKDSPISAMHSVAVSPHIAPAPKQFPIARSQAGVATAYDIHATGVIKKSSPPVHFSKFGGSGTDSTRVSALMRMATPTGATAVNATMPANSTVLGKWEEPRNRFLLISAMLLNTVVAASLYLAARLQSRGALVPSAKAETKQKDHRLPPSAPQPTEPVCDTGASILAADSPSRGSMYLAPPAREPGPCRGFHAGSVWRDPSVDLQVGDRSLEEWSTRRRKDALRRLGVCAGMTAVLLFVEVSVGMYLGSLALMSNGFHLLTDVAMYASLFVAVRESNRTADRKSYSFGLHRLEVVGVLIALISQYIITGNLLVTATNRLLTPHVLGGRAGQIICLTSTVSLIVNSSLAFWLGKTCNIHNHSHVHGGMASKMAWLHLVTDAVQNSLVIITGGLLWIDPSLSILDTLCTFAFAILIVCSTANFFRQLLGIVMERAPEDLDCEKMFKDLEGISGVIGVHCCHAWSIAQGKVCMSAHVHVASGLQDEVLQQAQIILKHRYGIHHTTLQVSDDEDLA